MSRGGKTKEQEIILVPISRLDDHPENKIYSMDESELRDLSASIQLLGVLQPLIIQPKENGRYEIVSGHRRKYAAKLAGMSKVPCVIKPDDVDDVLALIATNHFVRQQSPMTKAAAIRKFKERLGIQRGGDRKSEGRSNGQIDRLIQAFGESYRTLSRYDKLNDLIPELQRCVENGVLGVTLASQLASLSRDDQAKLYSVLGDDIGNIGAEEVKRLREQNDRGYLVLEMMQKKLSELEAEVSERRLKEGQIADLQRRIGILRAKKRELEYDLVDRENAARQARERLEKKGAVLLSLLEKVARPVAGVKPEIDRLLDMPLDVATASNLLPLGQVLQEVGARVVRVATETIRDAEQQNGESQATEEKEEKHHADRH